MPFTVQPTTMQDQFWGVEDAQAVYDNLKYLLDQIDVRHHLSAMRPGQHDDRNVPRAWAAVLYSGEFGVGGYWRTEGGSGCYVGNLPSGDVKGCGRIYFTRTFGNALYAPEASARASLSTPDAADDVSSLSAWKFLWFNRQTTYCDFRVMFLDEADKKWKPASNGCKFGLVVRGT